MGPISIGLSLLKYWKQLLVIAIAGALWWHGVSYGQYKTEIKYQQQAIQYQQAMRHLGDELEKEKAVIQSETKEKVRTVYVEADPTGCADTAIPNGLLRSLRSSTD